MAAHDETVEKVARAIYEGRYAHEGGVWAYVETKDVWRDMARAAIAAMGDGWRDIATAPLDVKALEAAARALSQLHIEAGLEKGSGWRVAAYRGARATITAYLAALPPPTGSKAVTDHAELIEPSPVDRGEFVGDIFYGDPSNSTRGTHRWTGTAWEALPTDAEVLTLMLAEARARITALVAERDALREALKPFAAWFDVRETQRGLTGNPHQNDETPVFMAASIAGEALITLGDLRRARAALAQGGE